MFHTSPYHKKDLLFQCITHDEITLIVSCFSDSPLTQTVHLSCKINAKVDSEIYTWYQRSNCEELYFTEYFFFVIIKEISPHKKIREYSKLLGKNPQPDLNSQDGNDALNLTIEEHDLQVVNFLVSQGEDTSFKNDVGKASINLAEGCIHALIIYAMKSLT